MKCSRCNRALRHPVYVGGSAYGSTCAVAVAGVKAKRQRAQQSTDARQRDFFAEDLGYAQRVEAILAPISLEMPR